MTEKQGYTIRLKAVYVHVDEDHPHEPVKSTIVRIVEMDMLCPNDNHTSIETVNRAGQLVVELDTEQHRWSRIEMEFYNKDTGQTTTLPSMLRDDVIIDRAHNSESTDSLVCAACGSPSITSLGVLGTQHWFRCRQCGLDMSFAAKEEEN